MQSNTKTRSPYRETRRLKAHERNEIILVAAKEILINEGFTKFSLRYVAEKSGIRLATLQYYYQTKDDLFRAVFEDALETERIRIDRLANRAGDTAEGILRTRLSGHYKACQHDDTAGFFYQLWARANLDEFAARLMDEFYEQMIDYLCELIRACNKNLSKTELTRRAVHVMATLEGMTLFLNVSKRRGSNLPLSEKYTVDSLMRFITET